MTQRRAWAGCLKIASGRVEGSPYTEFRRLEADRALSDVRLLAPVLPGKIIGVGRNYIAHAREQNVESPEVPLLFLKPPSSVIGPGEYHPSPTAIATGGPRSRIGGGDRQTRALDPAGGRHGLTCWGTRSATMSPPATCSAGMGSGHAAKASIPFARWDRGSRRSSTQQTR